MELNKQCIEALENLNLKDLETSIVFILACNFDLDTTGINIPEEDKKKLFANILQPNLESSNITFELKYPILACEQVADNFDEDYFKSIRKLWKGLKPGAMGSETAARNKLKRFFKNNPEVTWGDVEKASKCYLESLQGDYRYLKRFDYFIYKRENLKLEETSTLEIWLEEAEDFEELDKPDINIRF